MSSNTKNMDKGLETTKCDQNNYNTDGYTYKTKSI